MTTEIERKYLVRIRPEKLETYPKLSLRQGYLAVTEEQVVVRIREQGTAWFLTIKQGSGLTRTEVELPLSQEHFEALWPHTRGRRVEKTRYHVPVEGGTVELDVFRGELAGLVTAEVEFETVDEATQFEPPAWFGRDVTDDPAYQNAQLALHGLPPDADQTG